MIEGCVLCDPQQQIALATRALDLAFQPDHYNYAFLQNQDRHVHLHVILRYAESMMFGGERFDDSDYSDHSADSAPHVLSDDRSAELAEELRQRFGETMLGTGETRV